MPHHNHQNSQSASTPDGNLAALVAQGTSALHEGNLEEALGHFQSVVSRFPDRPEGHNNLGALYAALGRTAEAEACFNHVLGLLPNNPNVHFNRGLMRAKQENFAAATLDFETALHHQPNDPEILMNLGVTAYLTGAVDRARSHLDSALALAPDHVGALLNLCDLEEAAGDSGRAIDLCQDSLTHANEYRIRRRLLGLLLNRSAVDLSTARDQALALLAVDPGDEEVKQELQRIETLLPAFLGD